MKTSYQHIIVTVLFGMSLSISAQNERAFSKLDVSLSGGTTGLGIDFSTNITDWMNVRVGFDAMPRFEQDVRFGVASMDDNGNISKNFDLLKDRLKTFTGYDVNDYIDMTCKPTFYNFKFLMDFHPFKHKQSFLKNLSFTAGFYWGSSEIGTATNTLVGAQTLNGMLMFNHMYEVAASGEPFVFLEVKDWVTGQIVKQPVYLDPMLCERLQQVGRLGAHVGNYTDQYITDADGNYLLDANGEKRNKPYLMEPDRDGTVRARVKANSFKPYFGIGYGGRLLNNNDRILISGELGMLFWGGKPSIITHDGVDLARDVKDIGGKVGDYVDLVSALRVYPVLNLRLTYSLF